MEKKQVTSKEVIQVIEEHEGYVKMIINVAGGSETDAEQKLHGDLATVRRLRESLRNMRRNLNADLDGRLRRGDIERRCEGGMQMNKKCRVAMRKCEQADEVEVLSEKEMTDVRPTRSAGKAKEKAKKKENTETKEYSEVTDNIEATEHHRARQRNTGRKVGGRSGEQGVSRGVNRGVSRGVSREERGEVSRVE